MGMKSPLTLYWSRRDFRLHDNPALSEAVSYSKKTNSPFIPLFILEPYMTKGIGFGYSSSYMISKAIPAFAKKFKTFAIVHHTAASYLINLAKKYELTVFVNEDVHPDFYAQIHKLKNKGVIVHVCTDRLTVDKNVRTSTGGIYSIFTPFKNAVWNTFLEVQPVKKTNLSSITYASTEHITHKIQSEDIHKLCRVRKKINIKKYTFDVHEFPNLTNWYTTEDEALHIFMRFLKNEGIAKYKENRDGLSIDGTSKMSTALAWGLVSSRTLIFEIQKYYNHSFKMPVAENNQTRGALCYISELIWREFYAYLLFHNPKLLTTEFQQKYRGVITWASKDIAVQRFIAWMNGKTGYPIVDAAMNQLKKTGWMHNRARMIVASVLTKNFGVDWRWGQEYFRYVLVDIDEASNNGGWQWGASVGADPKPIRIFNADLQAQAHDADGTYRNTWLTTTDLEIKPIIEHKIAREEALGRYKMR